MLILIVAGGPDKGRVYELSDDQPVIIGREGADVQFSDVQVSRRHARLWADGGRWYITDLESKHGTHRNHAPVQEVQPLRDGDYLQVGRTVMVVARMTAEAAAKLAPGSLSNFDGRPSRRQRQMKYAAIGVAAALLLAGNGLAYLKLSQSTDQLAALRSDLPTTAEAMRSEVRLALADKASFERRVETMIAAFGPRQDEMLPKLDAVLATLEKQPDVAGPLEALAAAIEERDASDVLTAKMDRALALLAERGGDAEVLATEFRTMLAAQPTVEQIAAATRNHNERTVEVLGNLAQRLDELAAASAINAPGPAMAEVEQQLTQLRSLIEQRPADAAEAAALRPLLEQVLAQVENLGNPDSTQTVLAAIAEVKSALPADNSARLDTLLAQVQAQSDAGIDAVTDRIGALAAQLQTAQDTQLIQAQLAEVLKQQKDLAGNVAAATNDPLLGQILSQVQTLAAQDKKLDELAAALAKQPYDNRAMVQEVLAAAGDDTTEQVVAAMLDRTMAELRGKSITDADEIRRLISREVVAAVGRATGDTVMSRREKDDRLTKTETAYKLAFETGQKITIGAGVTDPTSGQISSGRTLDPAVASAEGYESWRDWYLMDDLTSRLKAEQDARAFAARQSPQPTLALPVARPLETDSETRANASLRGE